MNKENEKYTELYIVLAMLFVTCLIVSNLIAGKMITVWDTVTVPASVVLFPVTYILADVFTEVYGFARARSVIWTGFTCNFVAVFLEREYGFICSVAIRTATTKTKQEQFHFRRSVRVTRRLFRRKWRL